MVESIRIGDQPFLAVFLISEHVNRSVATAQFDHGCSFDVSIFLDVTDFKFGDRCARK